MTNGLYIILDMIIHLGFCLNAHKNCYNHKHSLARDYACDNLFKATFCLLDSGYFSRIQVLVFVSSTLNTTTSSHFNFIELIIQNLINTTISV